MQAYLNNPELKSSLIAEIAAHEAADQIIKGTYGEGDNGNWKGCAIGCALHSLNRINTAAGRLREELQSTNEHARFPAELGIPIELAYAIDHIFENLSGGNATKFPGEIAAAIPVGKDLSGVMPALLQWTILDRVYGWIAYAKTPEQASTVRRFAELVAQDWRDESVTADQWNQIDRELEDIEMWAWAWARARAWAWAWARARARARAWAGARARARAWAGADWDSYYLALSQEFLRLLAEE